MEGRQRRSFTDDYKRQAVDLVASSGRSIGSGDAAVGGPRGGDRPFAARERGREYVLFSLAPLSLRRVSRQFAVSRLAARRSSNSTRVRTIFDSKQILSCLT